MKPAPGLSQGISNIKYQISNVIELKLMKLVVAHNSE